MISLAVARLTRHVDLGVLCLGSRRGRQLQMHGLVLGVICSGERDRCEDVERDLSVGCGVVDRLELAMAQGISIETGRDLR